MKLILVRHGKAEERGSRPNDDERELTPKGREKFRKAAAGMKRLIPVQYRLHILTSPLPRALQTAEILAKVLNIDRMAKCDAIKDGNLSRFSGVLPEYRKDDLLFVVGHEPHLSDWSEYICGISLPFKKGAAACIDLNSIKPPSGKLLWFMQPEAVEALAQ